MVTGGLHSAFVDASSWTEVIDRLHPATVEPTSTAPGPAITTDS
jgi:hypothetical protein